MRKTTWYCDCCGRQIVGTVRVLAIHYYPDDAADNPIDEEEGAHLCTLCFDRVDDAIACAIYKDKPPVEEPPKQDPPPKKKKPAANKKPLDLGKIAALRNAGWSFDAIGDEMGVTGSTIRNHIDEAMEFLANKQKEEENND